jgi:hypothetical protein
MSGIGVIFLLATIGYQVLVIDEIGTKAQVLRISHQDVEWKTILDLESFGERCSWEQQKKTCSYLQNRISELGYFPKIHTYRHQGKEWQNILLTFSNYQEKAPKIIAIAHYDSKNWDGCQDCPGADDNGSGVLVLLKLAELLKETRLNKTVELVFSSNEEFGQKGSAAYVSDLKAKGEIILGAINVDIVGYNRPLAIFSADVIAALREKFTFERKIKILLKCGYNAAYFLFNHNLTLKLTGRQAERNLMPDPSYIETDPILKKVKFIIDDDCE